MSQIFKPLLASSAVAALLITSLVSTAGVASASGPVTNQNSPSESSSNTASVYVLDLSNATVKRVGDSNFYPLPEENRDSFVVMSDVAASAGIYKTGALTTAETQKLTQVTTTDSPQSRFAPVAADDGTTNFYAPPGNNWGNRTQRRISVISNTEKTYNWWFDSMNNTTGCLQGTGWYRGYNGSEFGLWEKMYPLGSCGKSGSRTVPWQGVSAYPTVQAKSMVFTGGFGQFN